MADLQKIRAKRAEVAQQRAALERLDAELAIAEKVLLDLEQDAAPSGPAPATSPSPSGTRRERILEALSGDMVWMTSGEINKAIFKRHGYMIKGSSLYPMLTQLKQEGVIVRAGKNGEKIAIKRRATGGSEVAN